MLYRVMVVQEQQIPKEEIWLRKSIFREKCKFGGKCCNIIIGPSSLKNMVTTKRVEKIWD